MADSPATQTTVPYLVVLKENHLYQRLLWQK